MSNEFHHVSVLLEECIEGLNIKPDGIYVDGTLGGAGHSSRIAAELTTGRHIGIDRDPVALKAAGKRLEPWADRVTLVHSNFCEIASVLDGSFVIRDYHTKVALGVISFEEFNNYWDFINYLNQNFYLALLKQSLNLLRIYLIYKLILYQILGFDYL